MKGRSSSERGSPTDACSTLMDTSRRLLNSITALMRPCELSQCVHRRLNMQRGTDRQGVLIHSDFGMMDRDILPAVCLDADKRKTPRDALLFAVESEVLTCHQRTDRVNVLCPDDTFRCSTCEVPALGIVHRRRVVNGKGHFRAAAVCGGDTFGDLLHASRHSGEPVIRLTPERTDDFNRCRNDTWSVWITPMDRADRHDGRCKRIGF